MTDLLLCWLLDRRIVAWNSRYTGDNIQLLRVRLYLQIHSWFVWTITQTFFSFHRGRIWILKSYGCLLGLNMMRSFIHYAEFSALILHRRLFKHFIQLSDSIRVTGRQKSQYLWIQTYEFARQVVLVLHLIFLGEDDKPWKLLKSLWNPAPSSDDMVFDYLIIHVGWNLVHVGLIGRIISSVTNFKQRCFLSQLLGDVPTNVIVVISPIYFTLLLVLIFCYV